MWVFEQPIIAFSTTHAFARGGLEFVDAYAEQGT
jgi:hypothetical protein